MKFYHGTPTHKQAQTVLKEGIQPDLSETQGLARPVEGRIYLSSNLDYAIIYLLGGDMAGHSLPENWLKKSRYGYLFVIEEDQLSQDYQPDEDQVGQAISERAFPWTEKYLDFLAEEDSVEDEDGDFQNLLSQLNMGYYAAWIKAGHLLLPKLSQAEKSDIIEKYGNIAHKGAIHPMQVWKFDKTKTPHLKKDGSNFFELAEQIL